ncbi:MAG: protein kinase [Polyangiaceae bacterium]
MDIEPGTIIANRYRVQKPLGRGGMGEVFAAENVRTGRTVAVKLLRADTKQKSSAVARFRREARAAGAIHSDYVTQVLDVEEDPEHGIVIVFELLEGESLIDRLKRTGPMSFDEIFPIVEQVWIGLADAHNSGVIHRDLKPSNVFLERRPDNTHRVKILDFGISKLTREVGSETLTEMGQNLGTFSFMPPEQIGKAKTVDHRADIYSCATLIYQAMSGQLPYAARNILMIVELKTKAEPRKLGDVMDSPVDPRLEAFLSKALKREPEDRFQTALEALEAWRALRTPAIPAPAPSAPRNFAPTQPAAPPSHMSAPSMAGAPPMNNSSTSGAGYPAVNPGYTPNPPNASYGMRPGASQPGMPAVRDQAPTTPAPQRLGGTVAINEASLSRPSVPSVADSTSDHGSDHVATVAIPMRKVADALANRAAMQSQGSPPQSFQVGTPYSAQPASPYPSSNAPQSPHSSAGHSNSGAHSSSPGAGLPKLHDDRPNLGTQLLPSRSMQPSSSGSNFSPSQSGYQPVRSAGTIAMNNFSSPNTPMPQGGPIPQSSGAYPIAGAGSSGAYPVAGNANQGGSQGTLPSAIPAVQPAGQQQQHQQQQQQDPRASVSGAGQTARHVPVKTADEVPVAPELQTAVYRRGQDGPPPTVANPEPRRSKAWLVVGMLGLLVLGFAIVTLVVTLVTKKFPFAP